MKNDKNVKFIRKNGRVIPIKAKNGGKEPVKKSNKVKRSNDKRSLTNWKKHRSSNMQKGMGKGASIGGMLGLGAGLLTGKSFKKAAIGMGIGAAAGFLKYESSNQGKTDREYIKKYKDKLGKGSSV